MNAMNIDCFCFDLDGTLLNTRKEIDNNTISKIIELKRKGYPIILASGRHIGEIEQYAKVLLLDGHDSIISCDGLYLYSGIGELLLSNSFMQKKDLEEIKSLSKGKRINFYTPTDDFILSSTWTDFIKDVLRYMKARRSPLHIFKTTRRLPPRIKIEKIRINNSNTQLSEILSNKYTVHVVETDGKKMEILPLGVNKYNALKQLKDLHRINNLDTLLFFGNDDNDRECFMNLKQTVAMGDTQDYLKKYATYITKTCDENGVYISLKTIL